MKKLPLQFSTDSVDCKPKEGPTTLSKETKSSVIKFMRHNISQLAPVKKNTIDVRSNELKKTIDNNI